MLDTHLVLFTLRERTIVSHAMNSSEETKRAILRQWQQTDKREKHVAKTVSDSILC